MDSVAAVLRAHRFFDGLGPEFIDLVLPCASRAHVVRGEFLFREGDAAQKFYVVTHGRVALEMFTPGRGPIVIDTVGDDDVVGWSWLFPPYRWAFDARAVDDTTTVALDGAGLRGVCEENPVMGYQLMKRFASVMQQRLRASRLRLLDLFADSHV